jgi:hypothetical protein
MTSAPVRAHPLVAMALRLGELGLAGMSADAEIEDGVMRTSIMTVTASDVTVTMTGATVSLECAAPDSVIASLPGRTLSAVVGMPRTGDARIDRAVDDLPILEASRDGDGRGSELRLGIGPVPDVEVYPTPLA